MSLVEWHLDVQKNRLAGKVRELGWEEGIGGKGKIGVGGKVKTLTWERLMGNKAVISRWQEVCPSSSFHQAMYNTNNITKGPSPSRPPFKYPFIPSPPRLS